MSKDIELKWYHNGTKQKNILKNAENDIRRIQKAKDEAIHDVNSIGREFNLFVISGH